MARRIEHPVTLHGLGKRLHCLHCHAPGEEGATFCRWCGDELGETRKFYRVSCGCTPDRILEIDDDPEARPGVGSHHVMSSSLARFCPECGTGFSKALHQGIQFPGAPEDSEPVKILVGGRGR